MFGCFKKSKKVYYITHNPEKPYVKPLNPVSLNDALNYAEIHCINGGFCRTGFYVLKNKDWECLLKAWKKRGHKNSLMRIFNVKI